MLFMALPSGSALDDDDEMNPLVVEPPDRVMQIAGAGSNVGWQGVVLFVLAFAAVAVLMVWLFGQLTDSMAVAALLAIFVGGYMAAMAWLTARRHE